MQLVPAKCPCCGADINVDESMQKTFCQYCGSQFFVEAASAFQRVKIEGVVQTKKADFEITAGTLINYHGESTNIIIPDNVYEIGKQAFWNMPIESIRFSPSIKVIHHSAFAECSNLVSVQLPNTLQSIDDSAFKNCVSLISVQLPISLQSIGSYAFDGCRNLQSIHIPASVKYIGMSAFGKCEKLEDVIIDNPVFNVINNGSVISIYRDNKEFVYTNVFNSTPWGATEHQKYVSEIEKRYMRDNLCRYCGNQFVGLFTKKCSKCGRSKDY